MNTNINTNINEQYGDLINMHYHESDDETDNESYYEEDHHFYTVPVPEYLNSLPSTIITINLSNKNLDHLPDLSRFTELSLLNCSNNNLTSLPPLNYNLTRLLCHNNNLTSLPTLNENLIVLTCCHNNLTSLPRLNDNLELLYCNCNNLTSLPQLNESLRDLSCFSNNLTILPLLNDKLEYFCCKNNPISNIIEYTDDILILRHQVKTLYKFKYTFYTLKYKERFRTWMWNTIEKNAINKYSPDKLSNLIDGIEDEDVLEEVLNSW